MKDILLNKNLKEKIELTLVILYQNNYKADNLDTNINTDKVKAKNNNLA